MTQPEGDRKTCFLLPHGSYPLLVATICTLGWVACLFQDGCDYAQVSGPIVERLMSNATHLPPWLEFGIGAYRSPTLVNGEWETSFNGPCELYPPEFMDGAWTTSRVFSFLSLMVGGGGTLFVWCSACFVFGRGTWRWTGYEILFASLCQGLSFGWFFTQICQWNTCALFWGSKADIVACVLWFTGGVLVVCRYPEPQDWHDNDEDEDVLTVGQEIETATDDMAFMPSTAEMT